MSTHEVHLVRIALGKPLDVTCIIAEQSSPLESTKKFSQHE